MKNIWSRSEVDAEPNPPRRQPEFLNISRMIEKEFFFSTFIYLQSAPRSRSTATRYRFRDYKRVGARPIEYEYCYYDGSGAALPDPGSAVQK